MTSPAPALLQAAAITKRFGGLVAVDDVSLDVPEGRITSLIGPNGAGKTTFFNCLTGELEPDDGEVRFDGAEITRLATHRRARLGIGRTFQRLEVFSDMTTFENVQVAAEAVTQGRTFVDALRLRHPDEPAVVERVAAILERLGLSEVADRPAGDLPTSMLRLIELGRALATEPRVVLADELASGLDLGETEHLATVLHRLAEDGLGILLIEHDVELVMAISAHVYVVDFGRLIASGPPAAVRDDPAVQAAYLGMEASAVKEGGRRSGRRSGAGARRDGRAKGGRRATAPRG
jgi:ABC-type branched-subunit amino acid transport system ATPase component